jgi:hypothetical protein
MSGLLSVVSYSLGTLVGIAALAFLVIVFIQDITQKKHTVLRNYPVIGHLRYVLEKQGEYFRQYFFMNDREELPLNRATRGWVYRLAKAEGGVIGFGSTNNTNEPGSILFVNHPYPVPEEDPPAYRPRRRRVLQGAVPRQIAGQHQRHEFRAFQTWCAHCRKARRLPDAGWIQAKRDSSFHLEAAATSSCKSAPPTRRARPPRNYRERAELAASAGEAFEIKLSGRETRQGGLPAAK